ncbi:hypothetical protein FNV43_RR22120 [Rhamnella rubrinervis]|uniref:1,4-dihydroxy-2-naphthoate octaprenyltransferase n=1 Tax=Rhamnella rubrinervis TaxID=2594499 RepID=A0A8K0DVK0_9ROSA|nr:hypothetical protein FNV43_RR22120 [Rhamnella rubrinervis]
MVTSGLQSSSCFCYCAQNVLHSTYRRQLEFKQRNHAPQASVSIETDYSDAIHEEDKEEDISKATLIWRAVKLPIYSVALVPITIILSEYFRQAECGHKSLGSMICLSLMMLSFVTYTYKVLMNSMAKLKEQIRIKRISCKPSWQASIEAGNIQAIWLLACAIICGYMYQCPPCRLSYRGLGEPLCFAAFGPFATTAFYLLQGSTSEMNNLPLTGPILSASLLVGLTTALILFCSHFHQIDEDKTVGKMSPLVRIGTERGSVVVKFVITALYGLLFTLGLSGALPRTCIFLCALTIPMAKLVVRFVEENHKDKQKIFMAKYYCVRLHTLFGAALAAGLVVARFVP